jgi:hypothetical protein
MQHCILDSYDIIRIGFFIKFLDSDLTFFFQFKLSVTAVGLTFLGLSIPYFFASTRYQLDLSFNKIWCLSLKIIIRDYQYMNVYFNAAGATSATTASPPSTSSRSEASLPSWAWSSLALHPTSLKILGSKFQITGYPSSDLAWWGSALRHFWYAVVFLTLKTKLISYRTVSWSTEREWWC